MSRAVRLHDGELRLDEVPDPPAPTGTQVLVRVAGSSVNGTDRFVRRGGVPFARLRRTPPVMGFDLAGEVVDCGPAVTAFAPGDRVVALLGHGGGGQADLVLLEQSRAAVAPVHVPLEQAAALPLAGLTALQGLLGQGHLQDGRGRRVLVVGAAGGIGSYAVQLAALSGASVTAVASGPERLAYLRGLGADEVVDRREHDVLTSGEHWDLVLDAPGMLTFREVRPVLADDGVLVSTRPISTDALRGFAAVALRRSGQRVTTVRTAAASADLSHLVRLVDTGRLRIPVDRTFPFAQVADAHRHLESGTVQGKVVLVL